MNWQFIFEPLRWIEILRAGLIWVAVMGWLNWTDTQTASFMVFASLILTEIGRMFVTPNPKV